MASAPISEDEMCEAFGAKETRQKLAITDALNRLDAAGLIERQGKRVPLKTKAAKRDIVLMEALGKLLRRHRLAEQFSADTVFVFQSSVPRRPMTYKGALLSLFHDACDRANPNDVTFHALRYTFASIPIAQGRDVQLSLGSSGTRRPQRPGTPTCIGWSTAARPGRTGAA